MIIIEHEILYLRNTRIGWLPGFLFQSVSFNLIVSFRSPHLFSKLNNIIIKHKLLYKSIYIFKNSQKANQHDGIVNMLEAVMKEFLDV